MDRRKGRFKTYCDRCNELYQPNSKHQTICDKCNLKNKKNKKLKYCDICEFEICEKEIRTGFETDCFKREINVCNSCYKNLKMLLKKRL